MSFQDFLDESDDDFIKEDTESRLGAARPEGRRGVANETFETVVIDV